MGELALAGGDRSVARVAIAAIRYSMLQYILGVLVLWDGCAIFVIYDICIFSGSTKQYT